MPKYRLKTEEELRNSGWEYNDYWAHKDCYFVITKYKFEALKNGFNTNDGRVDVWTVEPEMCVEIEEDKRYERQQSFYDQAREEFRTACADLRMFKSREDVEKAIDELKDYKQEETKRTNLLELL